MGRFGMYRLSYVDPLMDTDSRGLWGLLLS